MIMNMLNNNMKGITNNLFMAIISLKARIIIIYNTKLYTNNYHNTSVDSPNRLPGS